MRTLTAEIKEQIKQKALEILQEGDPEKQVAPKLLEEYALLLENSWKSQNFDLDEE